MNDKIREYEMLRKEILQYLGEYQTVRNMMYLVTTTILGFSLNSQNASVYLYLLPLIVILPSHIISVDYWKCVTKAAAYLVVFHEQEAGCPFHWESRHRRFNERYNIMSQSDYQGVPYAACTLACLVLYFTHINLENVTDILIGAAAIVISFAVFAVYRKVDFEKFRREWDKIKREENRLR